MGPPRRYHLDIEKKNAGRIAKASNAFKHRNKDRWLPA